MQELCDNAVGTCFNVFNIVPIRYKTQETCDRVVSDHFILIFCSDRYKTQNLCDETFDDCLAGLTFISYLFVAK